MIINPPSKIFFSFFFFFCTRLDIHIIIVLLLVLLLLSSTTVMFFRRDHRNRLHRTVVSGRAEKARDRGIRTGEYNARYPARDAGDELRQRIDAIDRETKRRVHGHCGIAIYEERFLKTISYFCTSI